MTSNVNDYDKFQQQIFDEIEEIEQKQRDRILIDFVTVAYRCGIDVPKEIKAGRPMDDIIKRVTEKRKTLGI